MAVISYLTTIQFDHGAIRLVPEELRALGITKPLVVTDPGLVKNGLIDRLLTVLGNTVPRAVFDGTPSNPTEEALDRALALYKSEGCDGLIGFGGGSSMDLAKCVGLMVTHPGKIADYALIHGGLAKLKADAAPLIAIPTTSGTGSEVGRGAVITLRTGRKLAVIGPPMMPKRAICDPELTLGLPPGLTAATGMDALAHCVETYISPRVNPPAEAIALDGVGRIGKWLERAVSNGNDREARWNMMMASMEGAMAFQKGLGAVHSLSHPLGALQAPVLHHGTLNAVVMPAVLRFNKDHVGSKYDQLRSALGVGAGVELPAAITGLNRRIGIPAGLGAMGVTPDILATMAEYAEGDHCTQTNPRPATKADFLELYREAM
ncbi:MAG: iron-containing alcohol dehydrogenase [Alphaproteobacteria bacterium]|nr:iron-containing alcohol dehydrogenase [Alphaproteobacteria bacterium]